MWKNIRLILLALTFSACQQQREYQEPTFETSRSLKSEVIASGDSLMTNYVYGLHVDEQFVYILAPSEGHWLQVRDRETGELVCRGGRSGQGPGELVLGNMMRYNAATDAIDVYDNAQHKVVSYKMDASSHQLNAISEKSFTDFDGAVRSAYALSDNRWLIEGQQAGKSDGRFMIWDGKDVVDENNLHATDYDHLLTMLIEVTSKVSVSPDGKRIAVGTVYGGILEMFSINNNIERTSLCKFYEPKVDLIDGNIRPRSDTILGFADVQATDDEIYSVLMGTTDPNKFDIICTFSWEGKGKARYQADCQVFKLADIPVIDNTIYAISFSEEDGFYLVKMRLSDE